MASITKSGGMWRVQIATKGLRDSKTFSTKAEAQEWASDRESELRRQVKTGINTDKTFQDAVDRYEKEVSAHKAGHKWESLRLAALCRYKINNQEIGKMKIASITPDTLGQYRDKRLEEGISGATIQREFNLLSHVFSTARREWRWVAESPTTDVRRPKKAQNRQRLISDDEIDRICMALGFDEKPVTTKSGCVAVAFLFAIETAMRAGEICGLTKASIAGNVAHLDMTKNGTSRDVPLSKRAVQLLSYLPDTEPLFNLSSSSLDALFRKAKKTCLIDDLTFHDTRHEAITRLAKKLNVLDLARMVGHRDLKMLQIYYNETAANMAKLLG